MRFCVRFLAQLWLAGNKMSVSIQWRREGRSVVLTAHMSRMCTRSGSTRALTPHIREPMLCARLSMCVNVDSTCLCVCVNARTISSQVVLGGRETISTSCVVALVVVVVLAKRYVIRRKTINPAHAYRYAKTRSTHTSRANDASVSLEATTAHGLAARRMRN